MKFKNLFKNPLQAVAVSAGILLILGAAGVGTAFAAKTVAESNGIGTDKAQSFAFQSAGVDPAAAENVKTSFEYDQGKFVYDVEFTANGTKYEYEIESGTGTVVKSEQEALPGAPAPATVTLEEAKTIALNRAGLTADQVTFTKAETDVDDGVTEYEIEFRTADRKYEYEIDGSGKILKEESKARTQGPSGPLVSTTPAGEPVTLEFAKALALSDAGLTADQVTFTKAEAEVDRNNLVTEYEIEFRTADREYEYEIGASGDIRKGDSKALTPAPSEPAGAARISLDEAKALALADAGLTAGQVTFTKAEADQHDGIPEYEIEFRTADREYEYEISASGAILKRDSEALNHAHPEHTGTDRIGVDNAKAIAAAHAGLSLDQITFSKVKLENDHHESVYEIEFHAGGFDYEYEIDARTGEILDWDKEADD